MQNIVGEGKRNKNLQLLNGQRKLFPGESGLLQLQLAPKPENQLEDKKQSVAGAGTGEPPPPPHERPLPVHDDKGGGQREYARAQAKGCKSA